MSIVNYTSYDNCNINTEEESLSKVLPLKFQRIFSVHKSKA
jgi:hypothetical protein